MTFMIFHLNFHSVWKCYKGCGFWTFPYVNPANVMPVLPSPPLPFWFQQLSQPSSNPWISVCLLQLVMLFRIPQVNAHHLAGMPIPQYIWVTSSVFTKHIHLPCLIQSLQQPDGLGHIKSLCSALISLTLRSQCLLFIAKL